MKERLDGFERLVLKLASLGATWIITAFIASAQIILIIVLQSAATGLETLDRRADWELNTLRWLLLPGALALYVKSAYYFLHLAPDAHAPELRRSITPINRTLAPVVMLALDAAALIVVPAAFNVPILLAVLERGLAYYLITAAVFAVFTAAFYWTRANPFAYSILLLMAYLSVEYATIWLSAEHSRLAFFNNMYVWNLANPQMLSPVMALYLEAEIVYELVFYAFAAIFLSLAALKIVYPANENVEIPETGNK